MIPILLNKDKTLAELVASKTGGIGELSGAYDGIAVEEANGLKEISFKLPIDSAHFSELMVGSYVKVKADDQHDPQIYEVYKVTKPINGIVSIKAQHISYILSKATVLPFTSTGILQTTQRMISNLVGSFPFTFQSDIVNTTSSFKLSVPMSFRKAIGGWQGSILDVFGGELDWDNLTVKLLANRGVDRGVKIEYGKNLTSFTQEESIANVYDAVIGYAVINETTYVGDIQKITTTNSPRTLNVDFSGEFESTEGMTAAQIKTRLNTLALAYAQNNDVGKPSVNLKISFEPLSRFEEYKDIAFLEQTALFDKVYVMFPKLGVESKAKIIRTEYDFINEKMISVELGDAKTNLMGLVENQVNNMNAITDVKDAVGFLDSYIENLSSIISNGLGLFFTRVEKSGGGYQYYLHNKPKLEDSPNQWTINEGGFAMSTDYGQTWVAGIDSQGNAVLNSLATITLKALEINGSTINGTEINGGTITGSTINGATIVFGTNDSKQITATGGSTGVEFNGKGRATFRTVDGFYVQNVDTSNVMASIFRMYLPGTTRRIEIENYDENGNYSGEIAAYNDENYKRAELEVYDDTGSGPPIASIQVEYDRSTGENSVELTSYRRSSSSSASVSSSITLDSSGEVQIRGTNVYFNGSQKW